MSNPTLEAAWNEYAERSGLTIEGVAYSPAKAQSAYFAFEAGWNRRAQPEGEAPQAEPLNGRITGAHACFSEHMPPGSLTSIGHAHVYKALQAAISHYVAHQPAAQQAAAPGALDEPLSAKMNDVVDDLREYAGNPGYSHGDYADTMRQAANTIESLRAQIYHWSAPGTPEAPKPPFPISDDEMAALRRFWECATDGEGYDVEKPMMQRLAEMGLVQRKSGAYYMATEFGLYVLGEYMMERAAQLEGGQEGSESNG